MPFARSAVRVAPVALVGVLALAGCTPSTSGTAAPSSSSSSRSGVAGGPTTVAASTPVSSQPSCAQASPTAIPDGQWTGPVILNITGHAGGVNGIASGTQGVLTLSVAGGSVTAGTFSFAFTATGTSSNQGTVVSSEFNVVESGTVSGPASAPVLTGTAALNGTAKVTSPVQFTTPVSFASPVTVTSTLTTTTCSAVTADFLPSLNQQVDKYFGGATVDTGTEVWTGHPA